MVTTLPQNRDNPVSQKLHQEQMNAVYQQVAGTAEIVRQELCQWQALVSCSLQTVLQEKETTIALARYLLDNMDLLDPSHSLPDATIQEATKDAPEDEETGHPSPPPATSAGNQQTKPTNEIPAPDTKKALPVVTGQYF